MLCFVLTELAAEQQVLLLCTVSTAHEVIYLIVIANISNVRNHLTLL